MRRAGLGTVLQQGHQSYCAAFKDWKMGYASALAVMLLIFVLAVNLVQDLFFKEREGKR